MLQCTNKARDFIMTNNPFHAVELKKPEAIIILDSLDDINIRDDSGANLLHSAIAFDNISIGIELINRGIDVNAQTKSKLTPLHYCAVYQDLEITRAILEKGGRLSAEDENGNTPLLDAVGEPKGTHDFLKLLLEYGSSELGSIENNYGVSPIGLASDIGDEEAARIISST